MFIQNQIACGSMKLAMAYDGSGRRISKTRMRDLGNGVWETEQVTHYTGIGTEIRENLSSAESETKVVVNMPHELGRYEIEDASEPANVNTSRTFEWFLKNHIGSTMLVYASGYGTPGTVKAAYDYRAFGEQIEMTPPSSGKVTENFTGKERDDETGLNFFGARYLDPMLGMWTSVDPERQFASPYLYAGNGYNPISFYDDKGGYLIRKRGGRYDIKLVTQMDAVSGYVVRDVAGAGVALVAAGLTFASSEALVTVGTICTGLSIFHSLVKGGVTEGAGGFAISAGTNAAPYTVKALESKIPNVVSQVGFVIFDLFRSGADILSKIDSDEFINEFNRRMQDPHTYNDFPTREAAEAFAKEITNTINNVEPPSSPNIAPSDNNNPKVEAGPILELTTSY